MKLRQFLSRILRAVQGNTGRDDGHEDGPGVPVPVRPRPSRGGAQAKAPVTQEGEVVTRR